MAPSLLKSKPATGDSGLLERTRSLRALVDSVPANILVADLEFSLVYMNRAAAAMTKSIESEIRAAFKVAWTEMLGGPIGRFHQDPGQVESLLRNPATFPHRMNLNFGNVKAKININGIFDDDRQCLGYVVVWDDVSAEAAVEAKVRELAAALASSSRELNDVSETLGVNAGETSAQAGAVAAGAEQLTASINEIARSASGAVTVANEAVELATAGTQAVASLAESSKEIDHVVKLITSIAEQTNLLALNATIEAARAGDAGKGFAVVASEVKDLARATAEATGDIANQVSAAQRDAQAAGTAIGRIHDIIVEINDLQTTVASAVEEQSATAREMATNISGVAQAAEGTSSGADRVQGAATGLSQRAAELQDIVASLLN